MLMNKTAERLQYLVIQKKLLSKMQRDYDPAAAFHVELTAGGIAGRFLVSLGTNHDAIMDAVMFALEELIKENMGFCANEISELQQALEKATNSIEKGN